MDLRSGYLQHRLSEGLKRYRVPGASLAVMQGKSVTTAASGIINSTTGVELTSSTIMHIGSITKIFNTTLIMQLVDEGRVGLDENVIKHLPELRILDRDALKKITVRMLLNHTSGIDGDALADAGPDAETIESGVARLENIGQLHLPGSEYSYCNAATAIAGYLAQRLMGRSWYRLIAERIFVPLQMEHAAALPEDALLHKASVGHFLDSKKQVVRISKAFLPFGLAPAGASLMVSAPDLLKFAYAHAHGGVGANGNRLLSEKSANLMQQMTVDNRGKGYTSSDGVGLGWMIDEGGFISHAGGGAGIVSVLYVHPKKEFAAAILTNAEFGLSWPLICDFIKPWLNELGLNSRTPERAPEAPVDPVRYVGVYENVSQFYRVSYNGKRLTLSVQSKAALYEYTSLSETPAAELIPIGEGKFIVKSEEPSEEDAASDFNIVAFRGANSDGRMRYLGNSDRLYLRSI